MSAGKGDKPRPVDKDRYDANYNAIDWSKKTSSFTREVERKKNESERS